MEIRLTKGGQRPGKGWVPVTRGAHRAEKTDDVRAALRAWVAVLPPGTALTHVTAARLLGLWLPPLPMDSAVFVQLPASAHPVRRPGLRALRGQLVGPVQEGAGLKVASTADVVLSLCRDFSDLDALMAVDAALSKLLVTRGDLWAAAAPGRHGAPRLRRVLEWADDRAESAWETVLREFHRHVDAPVTPQYEVTDECGGFVARGDLRVGGTTVLHEYDGGMHRDVKQHHADLRRERRLADVGWIRRGYTSGDLLHRAGEMLTDVDLALGREHDRSRVASWHATLKESALTYPGQLRLWPRLIR